jgi:vesicle coat complex subunit
MLQVAENSDIFAAEDHSGVIAAMLQKLLAALNERTEWGQVIIIDTLETLAKPKASSSVTPPPRLQHANSAVVMSAVKVTMGYLKLVTNSDTLRALSRRCNVQMCRCDAVVALRSGTFLCGLCARVAAGNG